MSPRGVYVASGRYRRGHEGGKKPVEKWVMEIERIEARHGLKCAIKAACVVWWDHLGNDLHTGVVSPLRKWIDQYRYDESTEPTQRQLVNCLVDLGYSRERAEYRSNRPRMSTSARSIEREHEIHNSSRHHRAQAEDGHEPDADPRDQEDPRAPFMGSLAPV